MRLAVVVARYCNEKDRCFRSLKQLRCSHAAFASHAKCVTTLAKRGQGQVLVWSEELLDVERVPAAFITHDS